MEGEAEGREEITLLVGLFNNKRKPLGGLGVLEASGKLRYGFHLLFIFTLFITFCLNNSSKKVTSSEKV